MADNSAANAVNDQVVASIVELFHMVESLIPDGQKVAIVRPQTSVREALDLMKAQRFSQLPVVSGNAVLGVFSYRSLVRALDELGPIDTDFRELPVDEFMEPFAFVHPADKWESTLNHLYKQDGVLVGNRNSLQGILTAWDVLTYLRQIASPFVLLAEIELSLRRIIDASIDEDQFKQCAMNSLAKKYGEEEMPGSVSEMTFNDYVQIVGDGRNWPLFETAFGKGEWLRKQTVARLKEVRDLRNDAFHFRRQLEEEDNKTLVKHRDWLEMKSRSFEGRRQEKVVPLDAGKSDNAAKKRSGKTNRAAFLAACDPAGADFFSWMLDKAQEQKFAIVWGKKGFSVRTKLHNSEASFAYGYPPNSYDAFQIYFDKKLKLSRAEADAWREEFMAFSEFEESNSKMTLSAKVTPANEARLKDAFSLVMSKVRALTRYPQPIQAVVQGQVFSAELLDEQGRVRFDGKEYSSPSGAGKDASGWKSANGWKFWQFYDDVSEEWRPIDDLRK